jgi:hypothetical protein
MKATKKFVVCLKNKGYEVSLEPRKIYQVLPDPDAARHRQLRVIDESGDDYLDRQRREKALRASTRASSRTLGDRKEVSS